MIWLVFAAMTLFALGCLLWPLRRARTTATADAQQAGVAIYEAQVAEIERDRLAQRASDADAQAARTEAARRFLAEAHAVASAAPSRPRRMLAAAVAASCFVLAGGLYGRIGHPALPDLPLSARAAPADKQDLGGALAAIEAHLAREPDDVRGWSVVAPVYLRLGRNDDAARAYGAVLRLGGDTAEHRADYGEALVYAADGTVTAAARMQFDAAHAADPKLAKARYYLGLAAQQDGDKDKAREVWTALAADEPANSALAAGLTTRIAALDRGALAAQVASLPADAQQSAIRGMVERLAARLSDRRDDLEGWLRLVRAYRVLKDDDKAHNALTEARRSFAGNADATAKLDALAHELGIEGG